MTLAGGWLRGRLRWQASSYRGLGVFVRWLLALRASSLASQLLQWIGCIRQVVVGFEGVIAGRPAPTVDWVHSLAGGWL
jgi:hypothetical protein